MDDNNKSIDQIKDIFESGYSSSPIEITDEKINQLIESDCKCDYCGKSIFELNDFPEIILPEEGKTGEVMCEDCYDHDYRDICPICEESYDTKDFTSDYLVITEEASRKTRKAPGIYKILQRPFFFGNCVTGFESFFTGAIELVAPIRINEIKKIECGPNCQEVGNDVICPDCIKKYVRKDNYFKSTGYPCILFKRYEKDLFKDETPEQLHQQRQWLIHRRITERGMIERGNHQTRRGGKLKFEPSY